MEIALTLLLPARLQRLGPFRIGWGVVARVDGGRGALEHVEVFRVPREEGHNLDPRGTRADDPDALIRESIQTTGGIAPGVVVVPPRRMKAMPGERFNVGNARQFRPMEGPRRQHHKPGANVVIAIGTDQPAFDLVVPTQIADLSGEDRRIVEAEVFADVPAVLVDLGTVGELLRRYEVELFEQRYVAVGFVIALDSGVAIPVPDATEIATELDDPDVIYARLLQIGSRKQAPKPTTENGDVDVLRDRLAWRHRCVRIDFVVAGEVILQLDVLLGAFLAQPLLALLPILLTQRVDIEVVGRLRRPARILLCGHACEGSSSESSRGSPIPMYFESWWCRLTVLRSR